MGRITYSDGTTPSICIIGAGFSGLLAGIQLKKELDVQTFTIFDENEDVGGTWFVNTYPGCGCDLYAHLYSYSFEPYSNWSHTYASQKEIWMYLKNVTTKYDLYRSIEFRSQVKEIRWDETLVKWRVNIYNKVTQIQEERYYDLVINATGLLRVPQVPSEFKSFEGTMVHTATWNSSLDLENKVIGVIGSGSSAIQLIPELAGKAKELHCYQRRPAWVWPRVQYQVPAWVQFFFRYVPLLLFFFRCMLFLMQETFHLVMIGGSQVGQFATRKLQKFMQRQIPQDELRRDLTPGYQLGCKIVGSSSAYYPALQLPNVKVHREPIQKVKGHSVVTSKGEQKLDVLILATGFQVNNYFAPMTTIGKNAVNIFDQWKNDGPRTYYGIMEAASPNNFRILGPHSGIVHNSLVFMIECQMQFIIKLIREMMARDAKVIELEFKAEEAFENEINSRMKKMVWGQDKCGSWFTSEKGQIIMVWPYSCIAFWWRTRVPDFSQFKFIR